MTAIRKHITLIALIGLLAALAVNPAKADVKVHIGFGLNSTGYYDHHDGYYNHYKHHNRPQKYRTPRHHQRYDRDGRHHRW